MELDEKQKLKLLLEIAMKSHTEIINYYISNRDKMMSLLQFAPLLIGIFLTTAFYIWKIQQISILTIMFAILFLIVALILGFFWLIPQKFDVVIDPQHLYEKKDENEEKILNELMETYLVITKKNIVHTSSTKFYFQTIILLFIGSVIEYSLFASAYLSLVRISYIDFTSFIIFLLVLFSIIYLARQNYKEIKEL